MTCMTTVYGLRLKIKYLKTITTLLTSSLEYPLPRLGGQYKSLWKESMSIITSKMVLLLSLLVNLQEL